MDVVLSRILLVNIFIIYCWIDINICVFDIYMYLLRSKGFLWFWYIRLMVKLFWILVGRLISVVWLYLEELFGG